MEFVVGEARFFKQCTDAISNLIDEGTFEATSKGLALRSMDPSQIAMVDFTLPADAFEKFSSEDKSSFGVNLVDWGKVLARSRSGEKLTISLEERESKCVLEFEGDSKRHFRMPLLDLGGTVPQLPKIVFDSRVKIRAGAFKAILHDAGLLSSHVVLHTKEGAFFVEAHGDSGDLVIETKKDSASIFEFTVSTPSRAMFPFEYLDDLSRAAFDDTIVEISLKNDAPVRVAYSVGKAELAYYLAPRVETV